MHSDPEFKIVLSQNAYEATAMLLESNFQERRHDESAGNDVICVNQSSLLPTYEEFKYVHDLNISLPGYEEAILYEGAIIRYNENGKRLQPEVIRTRTNYFNTMGDDIVVYNETTEPLSEIRSTKNSFKKFIRKCFRRFLCKMIVS